MDDETVQTTDLVAQVEALKQEVREKDRQLEVRFAEHERFKQMVGQAAAKGKAEHGWCSEIDTIMDNLGIEMPSLKKRAIIEVSLPFVSRPESGDHDDDWWRQSVNIIVASSPGGNGDAYLVYLDSDHEDVSADEDASATMASVEDYDED